MAADDPDDAALTPAAMLRLAQRQQSDIYRDQRSPVVWLLAMWGAAWLLGFLLLWSAPSGGNPWFVVPTEVAYACFGMLNVAALVASAVIGSRIGRGVKGASSFSGTVYGLSWTLSSFACVAVGVALARNGASGELLSLFFPSVIAILAGALFFVGAALWQEKSQLVLGGVLFVVGAVSPFFGAPQNLLVMALAGGGSMLLMAAGLAARLRSKA